MPPTTPRVDINKEIVDKAKQAMMLRMAGHFADKPKDLEKIPFSTTLAAAVESYKAKMVRLMDQAGLRSHPRLKKSEKRPRRVDSDLWEELGETARKQGLSRMDVVRALLVLLGDECNDSEEKQEEQSADPVPVENAPELAAPPEPVKRRPRTRSKNHPQ